MIIICVFLIGFYLLKKKQKICNLDLNDLFDTKMEVLP